MIAAFGIGGTFLALVVWYMRQPQHTDLRLSAARFLERLPPARSERRTWSLSAPVRRWRFYIRAAWMAILAAACFVTALSVPGAGDKVLRLAIIIDVSHSMGVQVGEGTALDAAVDIAERALRRVSAMNPAVDRCAVLWTVGGGFQPVGPVQAGDVERLGLRVERAGGDAALLSLAARQPHSECPPTHALVVTDRAAPADPNLALAIQTVWIDVTEPTDNVAIADVRGLQRSLGDGGGRPVVEIAQFGSRPDGLTLTIDTAGTTRRIEIDVSVPGPWHVPIQLEPGPAELALSPGGAYTGDDRVRFNFQAARPTRVDWHMPRIALPPVQGWTEILAGASENADLSVLPLAQYLSRRSKDPGTVRASVLFYDGFTKGGPAAADGLKIGLFIEDIPLLDAVNLDVLEQALGAGLDTVPEGFFPVLSDSKGRVVLARRTRPRAAIVPVPRTDGGPQLERLGLTIFFNALKWVTASTDTDGMYRHVDAEGLTISDALSEADTAEASRSAGAVDALRPLTGSAQDTSLWPWLVVLALLLLAADRAVGVDWRRVTA